MTRRVLAGGRGPMLALVLAAVGVSLPAVWSTVWPASGEPAYEFAGEYADANRGLADLGQRWYDPAHQLFYAADPAPVGDPAALVGDPQLTASYALDHANPYRYGDPDGQKPRRRIFSLVIEPDGGGFFDPGDADGGVTSTDPSAPVAGATTTILTPPITSGPASPVEVDTAAEPMHRKPWWWLNSDASWDDLLVRVERDPRDPREDAFDLDEALRTYQEVMQPVAEWALALTVPMSVAPDEYFEFFRIPDEGESPWPPQVRGMREHFHATGHYPHPPPPPGPPSPPSLPPPAPDE